MQATWLGMAGQINPASCMHTSDTHALKVLDTCMCPVRMWSGAACGEWARAGPHGRSVRECNEIVFTLALRETCPWPIAEGKKGFMASAFAASAAAEIAHIHHIGLLPFYDMCSRAWAHLFACLPIHAQRSWPRASTCIVRQGLSAM